MLDHIDMQMGYKKSSKKLNMKMTIMLSRVKASLVMTSRAVGMRIQEWAASIPTIRLHIKMLKIRRNHQVYVFLYPLPLLSRLKLSIMTSFARSCCSSLRASANQLMVRTIKASKCP